MRLGRLSKALGVERNNWGPELPFRSWNFLFKPLIITNLK